MFKILRKFIICLILINAFFSLNMVKAADAYFVWEKTVIDVPINSNLEEYKDDFVLKLYVGGKESKDYTVEMEVNCSTFSTVLTNKIGRYTVYYKAYSKKNYISSEQAIVFNVVDITPPKIELTSEIITIDYGKKLNDYVWYTVSDDTCALNEVSVTISEDNIIYNNLGTYNCAITAEDLYGNTSRKEFKVKIEDKSGPTILVLKPLIFSYGEAINFSDYILCKDNYNNDITYRLQFDEINTNTIGKKEVNFSITDFSGNKTELILEIVVTDNYPPVITLLESEVILDIENYKDYCEDFFLQYLFNIQDNYSKFENIALEVDASEIRNDVADYTVYFKATDENNNKSVKQLVVKLREFVGPQIIIDDVIEIQQGEELDLYSLIEVSDKYDQEANKRLDINYGDFDSNVVGTYEIKLLCFNTSGIYTEKIILIIVNGIEINTGDDGELDVHSVLSTQPFLASLIVLISMGILFFVKKMVIKKKQ